MRAMRAAVWQVAASNIPRLPVVLLGRSLSSTACAIAMGSRDSRMVSTGVHGTFATRPALMASHAVTGCEAAAAGAGRDSVGRVGADGAGVAEAVALGAVALGVGALGAPESRVGLHEADGNRGGSAGVMSPGGAGVRVCGDATAGGRGAFGRAATTRRVQSCHLPANSPQRPHRRWLPRIPLTRAD